MKRPAVGHERSIMTTPEKPPTPGPPNPGPIPTTNRTATQ